MVKEAQITVKGNQFIVKLPAKLDNHAKRLLAKQCVAYTLNGCEHLPPSPFVEVLRYNASVLEEYETYFKDTFRFLEETYSEKAIEEWYFEKLYATSFEVLGDRALSLKLPSCEKLLTRSVYRLICSGEALLPSLEPVPYGPDHTLPPMERHDIRGDKSAQVPLWVVYGPGSRKNAAKWLEVSLEAAQARSDALSEELKQLLLKSKRRRERRRKRKT